MLSQRLVVLFWYQGCIVALAQGTWLARCKLMMMWPQAHQGTAKRTFNRPALLPLAQRGPAHNGVGALEAAAAGHVLFVP
jgi:hypothetical protein